MSRYRPALKAALVALVMLPPGVIPGATRGAGAAGIDVAVTDDRGTPLAEAVVTALPVGGSLPAPDRRPVAIIDQIQRQFVPRVAAVRVGTAVTFPNKDNIRHHVYSFSPAKKFELPLYKGVPAKPVTFDRPGLVILGCNIHDWMVGYLYVVETPHFAVSATDGRVRLRDLPAGTVEVAVYHPRAKDPAVPVRQRVTLADGESKAVSFSVIVKPEVAGSPAPPSPDYP